MARYEIAGLQVEMAVSGKTQKQAAAYAAPAKGAPDMVLPSDGEPFLKVNPQLKTLDMAQYMRTGSWFARYLLDFNGFQLHASAVILEGKAYLFSAPSGTGKSTHTEKWVRLFGAHYLNDDKPALRYVDGVWTAYGTPWSGKHDLSSPESAPLGAVVFLKRGQTNAMRVMEPVEAIPWLLSQVPMVHPKDYTQRLTEIADRFLQEVPIWELTCRNDDAAAQLSHDILTA